MEGVIALAASAFLAATLLPASSEAMLAGLVVAEAAPAVLLLAVASVFNTAGSCVNWLLGRAAERCKDLYWFPVSADSLQRAQVWYRRYGVWSLLASWVPMVGDPLTVPVVHCDMCGRAYDAALDAVFESLGHRQRECHHRGADEDTQHGNDRDHRHEAVLLLRSEEPNRNQQ